MKHKFLSSLIAVTLTVSLSGFMAFESLLAPRADLWARWENHDPTSTVTVDHAAWGEFLKTYVKSNSDGVNRIAYSTVTDVDKRGLHNYLASLRRVNVASLNRSEQLAYWINLFNALTIRMIVHFYPVDSIQDINLSDGLFSSSGPWDKKLIRIDGEMISLNDIEHRILRPIWRDPRLHYAVSHASIGGPNLAARPYNASNINAMLNQAASTYVNSSRGVEHSPDGIILSKIYAWFSEDFGGSETMVLDHIARHASSDTEVAIMKSTDIKAYKYDWSLNDTIK